MTKAILLCGLITVGLPSVARAGLNGFSSSFVLKAKDGQHMLVMLSTGAVADDAGNECTLPNGQQVRLRDAFPSSGLYEIGSNSSIWDVDWYGYYVVISDDGRYLVRVNSYGSGRYPGGPLSWGIKFYDRGIEIKNHNVADLIDYPSLMEGTSSGWHLLWTDDNAPEETKGTLFHLTTSTHASYNFDITTGEILEEHRLWRQVVRFGLVALILAVISGGALLLYRIRCADTRRAFAESEVVIADESSKRSFSLRTLFLVTTLVAALCWIPHIMSFLISVGFVSYVTRRRYWRKSKLAHGRRARLRSFVRWGVACFAWLLCYLLSFGPFFFLSAYFEFPHDVHAAIAQVLYAPFFWAERISPDVLPMLVEYAHRWT